MDYSIKNIEGYEYIDEGSGKVILLMHGLFGALSNFNAVIDEFKSSYRVIIPILPIYEMPIREAGLETLVKFAEGFVEIMKLDDLTILGNSLGGHIALMFTLNNPQKVQRLALTGSSGLFENAMGGSYPRRGSYEYIKERAGYTFYNPNTAGEEYIQEIFEVTRDIPKCMRIVGVAKSAQRNNLAEDLHKINIPTLLIWGLNDTITPPMVAHDFNRMIENSELKFIDKCCHAPMMEHPSKFNEILGEFLNKTE